MYKQGDIIFMAFPNDDFIGSKQRPAIIVGRKKSQVGSYIVAKITSIMQTDAQSFELLAEDITLRLQRPSEVRCDCLMTVAEYSILKKFGRLNTAPLKRLCEQIKLNFDVV